jgi:hypothetical protein
MGVLGRPKPIELAKKFKGIVDISDFERRDGAKSAALPSRSVPWQSAQYR